MRKREGWRSVETGNGGECVTICGMKEMQLLCADSLDFQEKVRYYPTITVCSKISIDIMHVDI